MKMSKNKNAPSESICNPLSFSFFSFQFFLRQYALEVHGAAQSYPTIYQKLGLEFWIEKKDIMQAIVASHCALYQDSTRILAFFNIFFSELSGSRSGDRFQWRCNLTLLLFRQYWQTGIHDYPEKK